MDKCVHLDSHGGRGVEESDPGRDDWVGGNAAVVRLATHYAVMGSVGGTGDPTDYRIVWLPRARAILSTVGIDDTDTICRYCL